MSQFVARNGIISRNNVQVTGSLLVSGSTTLSGSVAMPNLSTSSNTNYVVIDTATGALTYRTVAPGSSGSSGTSGSAGSSGTSGSSGSSGTSGSAGSSGTSGSSGSSGTSGANGAGGSSGTSGTGFSTITNAVDDRILTSLGTANTANAETNLTFNGSLLNVIGTVSASAGYTGSLLGTASFAITASHALNAGAGAGVTINNNTDNFVVTATGTANTLNGETNLRFSGTSLTLTGSLAISSSGVATSLIGSGAAVFSVDGTVGRLFQVDDSLTGSLFSVNTAGGVPVMEAFSDNTVRMGQFGSRAFFISQSRVGIGKETLLNSTLDVSGSLIVTGSITGSLLGTASFAITASHALNSAGGGGAAFPHTGNAIITGSLTITTGSLGNNFPTLYTQGYTASVSGTISVIASNPTGSHRSAFYNYVATRGTSARAGHIAAVWYLTTCSFAEYVTTDIGTSADLDITARISGGNVQLVALGSGSWAINTSVNLV